MFRDPAPPREHSVIWIDGTPEDFAYVREVVVDLPGRTRAPRRGIFPRIVAYATLSPQAESSWSGFSGRRTGLFARRVWHVMPYDPYDGSGHPIEAVDPMSITAGQPSRPSTR